MGEKQKAAIKAVEDEELKCQAPIASLSAACLRVEAIKKQYPSYNNDYLKAVTPDYGVINIAKAQLNKVIPGYEAKIKDLSAFVEKKKRWVGKSTLGEATKFLQESQTQLKTYKELMEYSKGL